MGEWRNSSKKGMASVHIAVPEGEAVPKLTVFTPHLTVLSSCPGSAARMGFSHCHPNVDCDQGFTVVQLQAVPVCARLVGLVSWKVEVSK